MMRSHTKRQLDCAIEELKRDGYMVLMLCLDKHADKDSGNKFAALEITCSETNDPQLLAAMAKDALTEISRPISLPETIN